MNMQFHIHSSWLQCPYCDAKLDDCDLTIEIDERVEFECDQCGKVFWAETQIVYNTYSDCSLNGIEHEFQSTVHPKVLDCKNCYQHKMKK